MLQDAARQPTLTIPATADTIVARLERIPLGPWHIRLASILGVGTFFDAFDSLAIGTALTVIVTTFHIGFVQAGLLISAGYVGQFLGAIFFGYLAEKYGRRPAWLIGTAMFSILSVVAACAWSFNGLLWARIIEGIGLGAEVPIAGALFNEYVRSKNRGLVVGVYESLFSWGNMFAPLIGLGLITWLGPNLGWRALLAFGAIPMIAVIIGYFNLPESARWLTDHGRADEANAIVDKMEDEARARGETLAVPEVRYHADVKPTSFTELFAPAYRMRTFLSWTQAFTVYFITYGFLTWLPTLFTQIGGLPRNQALGLSVLASLISVVMNYVVAFSIDRVGRKPWFCMSYAFFLIGAIIAIVAVAVFHQTGWQVLFAASIFVELGMFQSGSIYLYTPELYPTRMRAWATSITSSLNRVASFIAPALVGVLLGAHLGLGSVFAMFGLAALIGLIVMAIFGIETKQRVLEDISA
jgi:putative MFS transporter